MKNKIIISFFINLLVGLLFSFPVFSAHNDVQASSLSVVEFRIALNDITLNSDFVYGDTKINFPNEDRVEFSKNKIIRKATIPGNKDNSKFTSSVLPQYFVLINFSETEKNLNPTFVNISYLKELRIIKMLC